MNNWRLLALSLATVTEACSDRKPPFSQAQFIAAKAQCGASDAYRIKTAPNTIGFHGSSDDHITQAKCLEAALAGTDVATVVVGLRLYAHP